MKLSFLFWQLQMPIVNVQQEVRYERSVISSDSCYFSFLSDFKLPNSNHGNSKKFDSWLWCGGEKGYQTLKLLERDVNQL